jgi:hypothetical protein
LQDGLHAAGFLRRQVARHELFYFDVLDIADDSVYKRWMCDWTAGFRCVTHVASSALRWGMSRFMSEDISDNAHLAIKACNNSSSALRNQVDLFVRKHAQCCTDHLDIELRRALWIALGTPDNMIVLILKVNPRWDNKAKILRVCAALAHDPKRHELITTVIIYFLSWRDWSDTRWAGVGISGRKFILSLFVGVQQLFKFVKEHGVNNDRYYIGSFDKSNDAVRRLLGVASLGAYPIEAFTLKMLGDDRFFLRAAEYWGVMQEKRKHLVDLDIAVYNEISVVLGVPGFTGHELRSNVLECVSVSAAYLERECYDKLREYPFSMTQGNIDDNVRALLDTHSDLPPLATKMQFCARMAPRQTCKALVLLRDAPCSIGIVEKGHRFGAVTLNSHTGFGVDQLTLRGFLGESLVLLRPSQEQQQVDKLQRRFDDCFVEAKRVRYTATNHFCSRLMRCSSQRAEASLASHDAQAIMRHIVGNQNHLYNELSLGEKAILAEEAEVEKMVRTNAKYDEARALDAHIQKIELRAQLSTDAGARDSKQHTLHELCSRPMFFYVCILLVTRNSSNMMMS